MLSDEDWMLLHTMHVLGDAAGCTMLSNVEVEPPLCKRGSKLLCAYGVCEHSWMHGTPQKQKGTAITKQELALSVSDA